VGDMNWRLSLGILLTVASLTGYVVGTVAAYPGRSFTITGLTVGLALLAIGRGRQPGGSG
jgi:hypothetical protein